MISEAHVEEFRKNPIVKNALRKFSSVNTTRQVFTLLSDWAIIITAIATSIYFNNIFSYALSILIIASRQHALLVMMHEGSHYRISKDIFYNDLISDNLAAYPLLLTTSAYRKNHLAHHKHTNTAQDPDWARKIISPEWQYPQAKSRILQTMWKQFINGPRDWIMLTYSVTKTESFRHLVFWALGIAVVTGLGVWKEFAMYWMIPLFFVLPVLQRTRSIAEHFGLSRTHELNQTRNIESTAFERFIFAPHRVSYHLTHHMFPSIPHYHLKSFNTELKKISLYEQNSHNNNSYFFGNNSVLTDLTTVEKTESQIEVA